MGTQEVELERAGEKSVVDGSDPVCSFIHIHIHLRLKSSGHVTPDSHKLQTKAINHSTRHYMNRRELESDQPIHIPLLRVLSFSRGLPRTASVHCHHSRAARATPSNRTQRYASCNCSELHCYSNHTTLTETDDLCRQNRARSRSSGDPQRRSPVYGTAYSGARIVWGDAAVAVRAGVAELATFVCRSSSDMICSDYASVIALCCQVS